MLSQETVEEIRAAMRRYPRPRSGVLDALRAVQKQMGYCHPEAVAEAAAIMDMDPNALQMLVTFYDLYYEHPVGEHMLMPCKNISCFLRGSDDLIKYMADKLGIADGNKKAAIGYCAGGGFVLEQARAGADFKAVVVFHVTNPNPVVAGTPCNIKGRVLAIHGSADPITPKPMMDALEQEFTDAKVDWQVMMFGGAVHSFCDPTVNAGPTRYDEKLCRKSYRLMRDFFDETF